MPGVIILQGCPITAPKVPEHAVAIALNEITYVGVVSCITLTGYGPGPLLGAHISVESTHEQRGKIYKHLKDWGALHTKTWYVIGNIEVHFGTETSFTGERWKSYTDIITELTTHLGDPPNVYTCDTSEMAAHYPSGAIHITATHGHDEPVFTYTNALTGGDPNLKVRVPHRIHRSIIHRVVK